MDPHIGQVVLPIARHGPGGGLMPLGTCFAVRPRKFATAAHVTGPSDEGLVVIVGRINDLSEYQDTTDKNARAISLKIVTYDPIHDICILEPDDEGSCSIGYVLGNSNNVVPGQRVLSLGFPHADHGRLVLTQQASMVGARVLLGVESLKVKHIVLNTQTRPGQSGGPVFTENGRTVCAMIVGGYAPSGAAVAISLGGIDPQTLHQTTHAVSAEYIAELL